MCLAVPVRVVELVAQDAAIVDLGGIRKEISLALVEDVAVGDYVILHVGYALTKLDAEEAERTLALFSQAGVGDASSDLASPLKGEEGRGMGSAAGHEDPSPPIRSSLEANISHPPVQGEGRGGDGVIATAANGGNPSPPLPPPLVGEGKRSVAQRRLRE